MKRAYAWVVVLAVIVAVGWVSQYFGYRRGYRAALSRQKAELVILLDELDQLHTENVDGATSLCEEALFRLANQFLETEASQSDQDMQSAMLRLEKYWDTYCANRDTLTPMGKRFGSLLAQRH